MSFTLWRWQENLPKVDDVVMVGDSGAYVELLDYDGLSAMILSSELSRRRICSIQKLVQVGRNEVTVVIRVDEAKGYVDLSKRRVTPEDRAACENRYRKSTTLHTIFSHMAKNTQTPLEDIYRSIGWPLSAQFGHALDALRLAVTNPEMWEQITPPNAVVIPELVTYISRRLQPQAIKVRADVDVYCFKYEGIGAIQDALRAARDYGKKVMLEAAGRKQPQIHVRLIAPPTYVMTCEVLSKDCGIELLRGAIKAAAEKIEETGGKCIVKMEPKAVDAHDDVALHRLMHKRRLESEEVSGDGDSGVEGLEE